MPGPTKRAGAQKTPGHPIKISNTKKPAQALPSGAPAKAVPKIGAKPSGKNQPIMHGVHSQHFSTSHDGGVDQAMTAPSRHTYDRVQRLGGSTYHELADKLKLHPSTLVQTAQQSGGSFDKFKQLLMSNGRIEGKSALNPKDDKEAKELVSAWHSMGMKSLVWVECTDLMKAGLKFGIHTTADKPTLRAFPSENHLAGQEGHVINHGGTYEALWHHPARGTHRIGMFDSQKNALSAVKSHHAALAAKSGSRLTATSEARQVLAPVSAGTVSGRKPRGPKAAVPDPKIEPDSGTGEGLASGTPGTAPKLYGRHPENELHDIGEGHVLHKPTGKVFVRSLKETVRLLKSIVAGRVKVLDYTSSGKPIFADGRSLDSNSPDELREISGVHRDFANRLRDVVHGSGLHGKMPHTLAKYVSDNIISRHEKIANNADKLVVAHLSKAVGTYYADDNNEQPGRIKQRVKLAPSPSFKVKEHEVEIPESHNTWEFANDAEVSRKHADELPDPDDEHARKLQLAVSRAVKRKGANASSTHVDQELRRIETQAEWSNAKKRTKLQLEAKKNKSADAKADLFLQEHKPKYNKPLVVSRESKPVKDDTDFSATVRTPFEKEQTGTFNAGHGVYTFNHKTGIAHESLPKFSYRPNVMTTTGKVTHGEPKDFNSAEEMRAHLAANPPSSKGVEVGGFLARQRMKQNIFDKSLVLKADGKSERLDINLGAIRPSSLTGHQMAAKLRHTKQNRQSKHEAPDPTAPAPSKRQLAAKAATMARRSAPAAKRDVEMESAISSAHANAQKAQELHDKQFLPIAHRKEFPMGVTRSGRPILSHGTHTGYSREDVEDALEAHRMMRDSSEAQISQHPERSLSKFLHRENANHHKSVIAALDTRLAGFHAMDLKVAQSKEEAAKREQDPNYVAPARHADLSASASMRNVGNIGVSEAHNKAVRDQLAIIQSKIDSTPQQLAPLEVRTSGGTKEISPATRQAAAVAPTKRTKAAPEPAPAPTSYIAPDETEEEESFRRKSLTNETRKSCRLTVKLLK